MDNPRRADPSQPATGPAPVASSPLADAESTPPVTPDAPVLPGPYRCAAHPSVETYLRCGRCERPICPRCMIQTPVGARCRDCAQLRRLPMFQVGWKDYLRGAAGALGAGLAGGIVLTLIQSQLPFGGLIVVALLAGYGYLVGEATARVVPRKRGTGLGTVATVAVVLGLALARAGFLIVAGSPPLLALGFGFATLATSIWGLLGLIIACAIAFSRLR